MSVENPLKAAALSYAERGWLVLPVHSARDGRCLCGASSCHSPGKHPIGSLVPNGLIEASTEALAIQRWWAAAPTANIGIRTGGTTGIVVLDVDPRHAGDRALVELEQRIGRLPPTIRARTGGGGIHILFEHPGEEFTIRNAVEVGGLPGIDLRGDGGYIVAPPSLHASGQTYRWEPGSTPEEMALAPIPALLRTLVQDRPPSTVPPHTTHLISDGKRNSTLTSLAGTMRGRGMTTEAITAALLAENNRRCAPPLPAAEVKRIATSISRYEPRTDSRQGKSRASAVLDLAGVDLFHAPDGESFATVRVGAHQETWPLRSKGFRRWLARRVYERTGAVPGVQALQDAIAVFEGQATYDGPEHPVFVRVARHDEAVYLDLGSDRWETVRITADGWTVVAESPVKFRRSRGMAALIAPVPGGRLDELRTFVNVATEGDWRLLVGWLVGALSPVGPYPVLALHGEQGSAKSTTARLLRALIDPNVSLLRAEPKDVRDLMIAASNGWCLAYDNLSSLTRWISDALCRLSTGGGFATRELHTDADEVLFDAQRPVILNGITEVATHSDLLDRVMTVELPSIPDSSRQTEAHLKAAFEAAQPRILGALCEAVATALRRRAAITLRALPRMADFALWVTAAEPALGWSPGTFLEAYHGNQAASHFVALDASPVAAEVRSLLTEREAWTGTAAELLVTLAERVGPATVRQKTWPANPRALGVALRRLAPNLRATGTVVEFGREPSGPRRRLITLRTGPETTVSSVSSVQSVPDSLWGIAPLVVAGDGADDGDAGWSRYSDDAQGDHDTQGDLGSPGPHQTSFDFGSIQPQGRLD